VDERVDRDRGGYQPAIITVAEREDKVAIVQGGDNV
jgi:hypothetical protein